mmetsp:Transcript_31658/g.51428  ORF Transcript_31658/g.51428 Transcript_31658/m.51428 type:complete len:304 (+) Transcript_31658:13-924(+)
MAASPPLPSKPFFLAPPSKDGEQIVLKVHPLVVFSILDHYKRRDPKQEHVIGILMGEVNITPQGKEYQIKNCFQQESMEHKGGGLIFDVNYYQKMATLQKKLNPKESVIGWYATDTQLDIISYEVYSIIRKNFVEPVHLVVDASLRDSRLSVDGYAVKKMGFGGKARLCQFGRVKTELTASEAAKIALGAVTTGGTDSERKSPFTPATMLSEMENLTYSLRELLHLLDTVSEYVDQVVAGKERSTPEIGSAIKDALAAIPRIDMEMFTRMFNQKTENMLMILYLTNIIRTQVTLTNRIYEVLD